MLQRYEGSQWTFECCDRCSIVECFFAIFLVDLVATVSYTSSSATFCNSGSGQLLYKRTMALHYMHLGATARSF